MLRRCTPPHPVSGPSAYGQSPIVQLQKLQRRLCAPGALRRRGTTPPPGKWQGACAVYAGWQGACHAQERLYAILNMRVVAPLPATPPAAPHCPLPTPACLASHEADLKPHHQPRPAKSGPSSGHCANAVRRAAGVEPAGHSTPGTRQAVPCPSPKGSHARTSQARNTSGGCQAAG
jgi:hypothetical protein